MGVQLSFRRNRTRAALATGTALLLQFVASPAFAEDAAAPEAAHDAGPGGGTDIVVTATRRGAQTVADIPLAIDAFSGDTLNKFNVNSIQDLTKVSPSLNVVSYGSTEQIVIRGISSSVGQTTGLYLDEAPLVSAFNSNVMGDGTPGLRMYDINDVEVLKGPQGTLFGAGSMDGTLRIVTNKPDLNTMSGSIEGSAATVKGGDGLYKGDAAINVPIINDQLALRAVAWTEQGGGYIDKLLTFPGTEKKNVNDEHVTGGRLALRWKPTENFTLDATAVYQRMKIDGSQYATSAVPYVDTPANLGKYTNFTPANESYRDRYQLYTLTGDYDTGVGHIVASGSYSRKTMLDIEDTSGQACYQGLCDVPSYPDAYSTKINFRDYTAELRFSSAFKGPLQITTGVYYENDLKHYVGSTIAADEATGDIPCDSYWACSSAGLIQEGYGNNPVVFASGDRFGVSQFAVYGQADYKILPTLTATAGARYYRARLSDQTSDLQEVYPDYLFGEVTTPTTAPRTHATQDEPTYNFSLMWRPRRTVSVYARAASGFRIGGINNSASLAEQSGTAIPESYDPDKLWDYELGTKFSLLDNTLSFDFSVFHIDWKGQQISALAAGTFNYIINAGKTRTNGVEMAVNYKPSPAFALGLSMTHVDAKLAQDLPENVVDAGYPGQKGDRVPYVPQWTVAGHAEYNYKLNETTSAYLRGDFNYRGSSHTAFEPVTAAQIAAGSADNYDTKLPSFILFNAQAGVTLDRFDVSLFVNNITNKYAVVGLRGNLNATSVFTAPPRTIGIKASAHF